MARWWWCSPMGVMGALGVCPSWVFGEGGAPRARPRGRPTRSASGCSPWCSSGTPARAWRGIRASATRASPRPTSSAWAGPGQRAGSARVSGCSCAAARLVVPPGASWCSRWWASAGRGSRGRGVAARARGPRAVVVVVQRLDDPRAWRGARPRGHQLERSARRGPSWWCSARVRWPAHVRHVVLGPGLELHQLGEEPRAPTTDRHPWHPWHPCPRPLGRAYTHDGRTPMAPMGGASWPRWCSSSTRWGASWSRWPASSSRWWWSTMASSAASLPHDRRPAHVRHGCHGCLSVVGVRGVTARKSRAPDRPPRPRLPGREGGGLDPSRRTTRRRAARKEGEPTR